MSSNNSVRLPRAGTFAYQPLSHLQTIHQGSACIQKEAPQTKQEKERQHNIGLSSTGGDSLSGLYSVGLSTNSLVGKKVPHEHNGERRRSNYVLTSRFKCSMKTCKLTSSVKMACPAPAAGVDPYIVADICVVEGLSLERRKRA